MKKTILITGSTDGIGKLAAFKLTKAGHKVLLHGRNREKLNGVIEEFKSLMPSADVSGYISDLSNLTSVKTMADKIKEEHTSIEVLINNAGVFLSAKPRNAQGLDIRFVVNFLAPIVLTEGLLPTLKAGDQPRVINLSSAAQAPVSLNAVVGKEALGDQAAYAQSKLALTMWNTQMAKTNLDITFIAVNPGSLLNTKMVQEAYGKHWAPADKGADILVELATDPKHVRMSGKYFDNDNGNYAYASPDAYEQVKIDQLMETANVVIKQEL